MDSKGDAPQVIVVSVSVFGVLRSQLGAKEVGMLRTVQDIHHAG
jgi:hypothetical protein